MDGAPITTIPTSRGTLIVSVNYLTVFDGDPETGESLAVALRRALDYQPKPTPAPVERTHGTPPKPGETCGVCGGSRVESGIDGYGNKVDGGEYAQICPACTPCSICGGSGKVRDQTGKVYGWFPCPACTQLPAQEEQCRCGHAKDRHDFAGCPYCRCLNCAQEEQGDA